MEVASRIARRSTAVAPDGTPTTMRLLMLMRLPPSALVMKCFIIRSATSISAITPSRSGRIAWIDSGVLPSISRASSPTARTVRTPLIVSVAITEGSLSTMPRSRTWISVLTVPRSMARSCLVRLKMRRKFIGWLAISLRKRRHAPKYPRAIPIADRKTARRARRELNWPAEPQPPAEAADHRRREMVDRDGVEPRY